MLETQEIPAEEIEAAPVLTVTESEFGKLDRAIRDYIVAKAEEEKAKADLDKKRAALLQTLTGINPDISTEVAGLSVNRSKDVIYNEAAALEYLLREENLAAAADMLAVRKASRGVLVGAAIMTPALRSIFEVDDAAYKRAVRGGLLNDLPVTEVKDTLSVSVSVKAVRFGDELRKTLNVIEDAD